MSLIRLVKHEIRHRVAFSLLLAAWAMGVNAADTESPDTGLPTSCVECHEDSYQAMSSTSHWGIKLGDDKGKDATCIRCHGPDVQHAVSEQSEVVGYGRKMGPEAQAGNDLCLDCHKNSQLLHWHGSVHESEDVSCAGCHVIHGTDKVLERKAEARICYLCHQAVRGQSLKPYNHPIKEEKLSCSDCHQSHGGNGPAALKGFTVTESCTACHPGQRGPFLWEHQPVSESCTLCHNAHGSINPGMLLARGPQLCQMCHQPTSDLNARHARLALGYSDPDSGGPGPGGGPAGISRFVLSRNCMNCHFQVHGSNHPSGAMFER